jgi:hypothetical protein
MRMAAKIGLTVVVIVAGAAAIGVFESLYGQGPHRVVGWAIVALLILLIWLPKWPVSQKSIATANNALFAEHALGFIELTPRNPSAHQLGQQLISTMRRLGTGLANDTAVIEDFNGKNRLAQLNLIAMAMIDLKQSPMLGETWETPNAQATEGASARAVAAATEAIFGKHGVAIAVPERRFRIEGGCLLDAGDLAPPPKSPPPPPDLMRQAIYGAFAFFLEQTKDEKVDFNEYHLLVLKSYVTAISIPISTAEPIVAMARLADLPKGWEQWAVSAIVDELFRMVHDQIYKK